MNLFVIYFEYKKFLSLGGIMEHIYSKNDINVVFFDLFFTLITPKYNDLRNENDVLGMSIEEWESYAEDLELYNKRASNKNITPELIIQYIIEKMKLDIAENDKNEILNLRQQRLKNALLNIDYTILNVLSDLKKSGKRICLISTMQTCLI